MDVLVCVAGLPYARPALWYGSVLGRIAGVNVTLLHVATREDGLREGEWFIDHTQEATAIPEATTRVRHGSPQEEILAEIKESDYRLVILGANRGAGLRDYFLGSVSSQIVRRSPISVLVAKEVRSSLRRILICSGGVDLSERIVESGGWLAEAVGAEVTLLHVTTPVASMYTGLKDLDETLTELLQTDTPIARHLRRSAEILDRHQVPAELGLRHGVPADEIVREAHAGDHDLIVVGASKRGDRLKRLMLGDVTQEVVDKATRSVLVVKSPLEL